MYLPLLGLQTRKSISIMLTSAIRHRLSLPCAKLRSQRKVLQHLLPNHYVHDSCAFRQGFGYNAFGYTTSSSSGGSHSNQAPGGGWQEGGGEGDGGWKQNGGAGRCVRLTDWVPHPRKKYNYFMTEMLYLQHDVL